MNPLENDTTNPEDVKYKCIKTIETGQLNFKIKLPSEHYLETDTIKLGNTYFENFFPAQEIWDDGSEFSVVQNESGELIFNLNYFDDLLPHKYGFIKSPFKRLEEFNNKILNYLLEMTHHFGNPEKFKKQKRKKNEEN